MEDHVKTAILVDGGFYRKRVKSAFGEMSPEESADWLEGYCRRRLKEWINGDRTLS